MLVYCSPEANMAAFPYCGFCLLLLTACGVFSEKICSPQDVLDYLNLTKNAEKFTNCRPVLDWTRPTELHLDIFLAAILSVIEKSQVFVHLLWMSVTWNNELISWNPADFCGITQVTLPREMLWKPDIHIHESIDKEHTSVGAYLRINYEGEVTMEDKLKIASSCRMDMHKFPFDTQSCQITIASFSYTNKEMKLISTSNSSLVTQYSREFLLTQGEWELLNMTVQTDTLNFEKETIEFISYTISIRRVPLLHALNFLLPVLFFLTLDLASFFIPNDGEKLNVKVTVLLAISVLLLILHDILPSKSNSSPLIAIYIICIFAFMLLSVLETILVIFLINLDLKSEDRAFEHEQRPFTKQHRVSVSEMDNKERQGSNNTSSTPINSPSESLKVMDWGKAETITNMQLLQALQNLQTPSHNLPLPMPKTHFRNGYWGRMAKCINKAFFVFYFISICLFLILISVKWSEQS